MRWFVTFILGVLAALGLMSKRQSVEDAEANLDEAIDTRRKTEDSAREIIDNKTTEIERVRDEEIKNDIASGANLGSVLDGLNREAERGDDVP